MRIDRLFGSDLDETPYRRVAGSLAPALLWNEFDGFKPRLRFYVDLPLPQLNERFKAFIGRVNPDEYITERSEPSGAFRRQYGPARGRGNAARHLLSHAAPAGLAASMWAAACGCAFRSIRTSRAATSIELGKSETGLLSLRQTVFWRNARESRRHQPRRISSASSASRGCCAGTISGTFSRSAPTE